MSPLFRLLAGGMALAFGIWMLFFQHHFQAMIRRRHERQLADRHARGRDAYFEELRALDAYPPDAVSSPMQRITGALMILAGGTQLAILLNK